MYAVGLRPRRAVCQTDSARALHVRLIFSFTFGRYASALDTLAHDALFFAWVSVWVCLCSVVGRAGVLVRVCVRVCERVCMCV
jgi:hypothetical protein